jgi:hypothetical protein
MLVKLVYSNKSLDCRLKVDYELVKWAADSPSKDTNGGRMRKASKVDCDLLPFLKIFIINSV